MLEVCSTLFMRIDIAVFSGAVADYRPVVIEESKIKKKEDSMSIGLIKNPDIALEFGIIKSKKQLSVGFALETDDLLKNGIEKLHKKHFDLVVLNSPNNKDQGFGFDTNKISILSKDLSINEYSLKSKSQVAEDIISDLSNLLKQTFKTDIPYALNSL